VSAKAVREEGAAQQAQLSSLIFQRKSEAPVVEKQSSVEPDSSAGLLTKMLMPEKKKAQSGASAPLPVKANPAPGTSTFDFEAGEVKIPAWLEPLARNSPASAAVFETRAPEIKANEIKFGETSAGSSDSDGENGHGLSAKENSTEYSEKHEAVLTLSGDGPTPNFGSSLALDSRVAQNQSAAGGSRKGLVLGLLAAGLLLAAAGGWYWYSNQPQSVSTGGSVPPQQNVAAATAPIESAPDSRAAASSSVNFVANAAGNRNPVNSTPVGGDSNGNASSVQPPLESSAPAPEPTAKPTLGKVHLAAPVVNHKASSANNAAVELAPALNDTGVNGGDPGSLGLLTSKGKQPAAPLPVGGDVKQARLISSVTPVYPQLARNQRLSGDVVIDALVDAHGNVTTMKVISGPALLHQAAMDALRQWKYQPATLNGQAMAMHLSVTMQFKPQ
jgi:protein TonB